MSPEALRRRMAHGNVYPSDRVDAALSNYFRIGNLTALRELALLWLADRVDEGLAAVQGRTPHRSRLGGAGTGGGRADRRPRGRDPDPPGLADRPAIRRRPPGRARAVLRRTFRRLAGRLRAQRALVEALGGSFHQVVGDDVGAALLEFARSVDATQLVIGTSRRSRWARAMRARDRGPGGRRFRRHRRAHRDACRRRPGGWRLPPLSGALTVRRRVLGLALALVRRPTADRALPVGRGGALPLRGPAGLPAPGARRGPGRRLVARSGRRRARRAGGELVLRGPHRPLTVAGDDVVSLLGGLSWRSPSPRSWTVRPGGPRGGRSQAETALLAVLLPLVLAGNRGLPSCSSSSGRRSACARWP